jgi:hypothetical protein
MRKALILIFALVAQGAMSVCAWAHHSKAMFDDSKCLELEGTVRNFEWQFPHSWVWVVVPTSGGGGGDIWGFESMSPSQLVEVDPRWTRNVVSVGDKVKVKFSPLKDGRHGGSMNTLTIPDGRVLLGAPNSCLGGAAVYGSPAAAGQSAPQVPAKDVTTKNPPAAPQK